MQAVKQDFAKASAADSAIALLQVALLGCTASQNAHWYAPHCCIKVPSCPAHSLAKKGMLCRTNE
jgi:hypothetical protein